MKKLFALTAAVCAAAVVLIGCAQFSSQGEQPSILASGGQETQAAAAEESTITVSTTETVKVSPDIAYVEVGVRTEGRGAAQVSEQNARKVDAMLAAVKALGLTDDEIKTSYINMYPDYEDPEKVSMENTFQLTIKNIDDVGRVIDAAVAAGANTSYSMWFDISDRDERYIEALGLAMQSVTAKAESVADAGGYSIVRPLRIEEAGSSAYGGIMRMDQVAAEEESADTASTTVMPSDVEVTATVTGTYVIQ